MRNNAYLALCLIVLLAGCGSPASVQQPIPTPPPPAPISAPDPIDIVKFLFSTKGRAIGPASVFDVIGSNQAGDEIVRVTYDPTGDKENHSVYGFDISRGCITVKREEAWNRPPTVMSTIQRYTAEPCWISRLFIAPGQTVETKIVNTPYTWSHFDPVTGAHLDGDAKGTFSDHTVLTADLLGLHLLEGYWDTSIDPAPPDPYCVRGDYDKLGLGKLTAIAPPTCVQP